jgi:glycosyltransferase involved in cell wall biosynthesis
MPVRKRLEVQKVSVIVATYNRADYLRLCLASLLAQDYAGRWEVVVADDGSTDETPQVVADAARRRDDVSVTHSWRAHERYRRAFILNEGVRQASGDLLVFLDSDSVPAADLLSVYAAHAAPGRFYLGGAFPLSREFSEPALAARSAEGLSGFLAQAALPSHQEKAARKKFLARAWKSRLAFLGLGRPKIRGNNFAVNRQVFEAVNGFDENFVGYGQEDSDLRDRFLRSGCRPLCLHLKALVYHLWHPVDMNARREASGEGNNRPYYHRSQVETVCRNGLRKL